MCICNLKFSSQNKSPSVLNQIFRDFTTLDSLWRHQRNIASYFHVISLKAHFQSRRYRKLNQTDPLVQIHRKSLLFSFMSFSALACFKHRERSLSVYNLGSSWKIRRLWNWARENENRWSKNQIIITFKPFELENLCREQYQ